MPKKLRVRTFIDSQHGKRSETLLNSVRQYFCYIFWSLSKKISSKTSFLEVSEILRLFLTIVTPNNEYILSIKASVEHNKLKCNYLKINNIFLTSFFHFWNLHIIWNSFKRKLILRGDFFLELLTGNRGVT